MPFTVANPNRTQRYFPPSRSNSENSDSVLQFIFQDTPAAVIESERHSLHSFVSSSENTAVSDHPQRSSHDNHDKFPERQKEATSSSSYNTLPTTPWGANAVFAHKAAKSDVYNDHLLPHSSPYTYKPIQSVSHHPLTTNSQLAAALGPDNISYTTEIATIPCAGVRISHGPLTGLLAWRLIVCNPSPIKPPKRSWWGSGDGTREEGGNRPGTRAPILPMHTAVRNSSVWSAASATSLPMKGGSGSHVSLTEGYNVTVERPQSAMTVFGFPRYHEAEHAYTRQASQSEIATATIPVVATNFILDTSLPYSIISRDTLTALGYSPAHFPSSKTDPHAVEYNTTEENRHSELIVSLSIQGVTTRVRVGRPGEASRLGVQYLRDASISVFFPRDGDGVGPVLYYESARLLRDVPLTITSLPGYGKYTKPSLPQRVRALFGLSP